MARPGRLQVSSPVTHGHDARRAAAASAPAQPVPALQPDLGCASARSSLAAAHPVSSGSAGAAVRHHHHRDGHGHGHGLTVTVLALRRRPAEATVDPERSESVASLNLPYHRLGHGRNLPPGQGCGSGDGRPVAAFLKRSLN